MYELKNAENIKIYKDVTLKNNTLYDNVSIGDFSTVRNSTLFEEVEIGRRNTIDTANIGKGTYTGEFCIIKHATIGKYCAISWNVSIGGANHDIDHICVAPVSRIFPDEALTYESFNKEINIGNDVWIAAGAHILRGINIGDGAVIAANAVVTHNVEPYAIMAGVPAQKIGQRFDDEIISRLQKLKWWNWDEKKLSIAKDYFKVSLSDDILAFLESINGEK